MTDLAAASDHTGGLPYGVFSRRGSPARAIGVRAGDVVLDLAAFAERETLAAADALSAAVLNPFMALGPAAWREVREALQATLASGPRAAVSAAGPVPLSGLEPLLVPLADVEMHLPFDVADYVDFYASEHHAANLGRILRPDSEPLLPNWRHLPVGYHGRAGTVVVSGTPVVRPSGQRKAPADAAPSFGPTRRLDFEAEVGFVVGVGSALGTPVPMRAFAEQVFGVVLVNDWSARDIQAWEYVPLGPFLGKSFATSVSAWVTPLDALGAARIPPPARDPRPLPYLDDALEESWGLDLTLEVSLNGHVVSRPPFGLMYWTAAQQLAHMTSNGASLRTGDLFASGTVSGPRADERGSLMELSWGGTEPLSLPDGSSRTFLEDGDEVVIRATAPGGVGVGEVTGRVLPATGA